MFSDTVSQELAVFSSGTQLTTGLSMERIWGRFKPRTPGSVEELERLLNLESLVDRFDNFLWQSQESIAEMCKIRQALSNALSLLTVDNTDANELINVSLIRSSEFLWDSLLKPYQSLESGVHSLEQRTSEGNLHATHYFEDEFEGICQFIDVLSKYDDSALQKNIILLRAKSSLLAKRPTKSAMSRAGGIAAKTVFHLFNYLGLEKVNGKAIALGKTFHTSMLRKM